MAARALSKASAAKTWTDTPRLCSWNFFKVTLPALPPPDGCQQPSAGASPRFHPCLGCSSISCTQARPASQPGDTKEAPTPGLRSPKTNKLCLLSGSLHCLHLPRDSRRAAQGLPPCKQGRNRQLQGSGLYVEKTSRSTSRRPGSPGCIDRRVPGEPGPLPVSLQPCEANLCGDWQLITAKVRQ